MFIIARGPEMNLAPNTDVAGLTGIVYNMGWLKENVAVRVDDRSVGWSDLVLGCAYIWSVNKT